MTNFNTPSDNMIVPADDGACAHLPGMKLPATRLTATSGAEVELSSIPGRLVLYFYPMTGRPGVPLPATWDEIPGARGCTPQTCSFRDHYAELQELGANVFGISTQDSDYQREAAERLNLPFPLLSDKDLVLAHALSLPTFEVEGKTLIKRLALIAHGGKIVKVFYPVFPPGRNADDVIAWLSENK